MFNDGRPGLSSCAERCKVTPPFTGVDGAVATVVVAAAVMGGVVTSKQLIMSSSHEIKDWHKSGSCGRMGAQDPGGQVRGAPTQAYGTQLFPVPGRAVGEPCAV